MTLSRFASHGFTNSQHCHALRVNLFESRVFPAGGDVLLDVTADEIREVLGVTRLGHVKLLQKALQRLRSRVDASTELPLR